MDLGNGLGHLSYSTLVHPGDTWAEMRESLEPYLPAVKRRVSPDAPFGVSLRISAASADTLTEDPAQRAGLTAFLAAAGPLRLHRQRLPLRAVQGRLGDGARLRARLDHATTASPTPARSPTSWPRSRRRSAPASRPRRWPSGPTSSTTAYVDRFTTQLFRVVAHLVALEARTGRRVKLALEPEPACYLETTDETIAYFRDRMHARGRRRRARRGSPGPLSEAEGLLRRHLGRGLRHRPPVRRLRGHPRLAARAWSPRGSRSSSCRRRRPCGSRS